MKKGETITRIGNFSHSNGIIADGLECVIGTLGLFANLNLAGRDLVKIYKARPELLENNVIAHSQGTIKTTAVFKDLLILIGKALLTQFFLKKMVPVVLYYSSNLVSKIGGAGHYQHPKLYNHQKIPYKLL